MNDHAAAPVVDTDNGNQRDITFFVACYNEEVNIVSCLTNLVSAVEEVGLSYDIVLIDDASTDSSVRFVQEFMQSRPDVPMKLLVNSSNQGLGANYAEASFHGRGKYFRTICGDDEERRETIVEVLKHVGQADMILTYHADPRARPWLRRLIARTFTGLVNFLGGHQIRYYNGLAIHLRYNVMRWHSYAHGFGFQADLLSRLLNLGATYIEIPVVPKERTSGRTKAFTLRNFCSIAHTLLEVFIRRVANLMYPRNVTRLKEPKTTIESPGFRNGA